MKQHLLTFAADENVQELAKSRSGAPVPVWLIVVIVLGLIAYVVIKRRNRR